MLLQKVGIACCAVSLILDVVGLAIPYWIYVKTSVETVDITTNYGLWSSCLTTAAGKDSQCASLSTVSDKLQATRALVITGMVGILGALVCAILQQGQNLSTKHLHKLGAGIAAVAGLLMIIGTILFATDSSVRTANLHAGFALCMVAGALGIFAGVLLFINK